MIPKELVEQLRYIEIYTLKSSRNDWVGGYLSPLKGRGFEFDQHKRYQPGDDYRQIDWNVTARMRHPYVKREFEEKEMSAIIMADLSRSMEFGTAGRTKREILLEITAALAFSAVCDSMKVGLLAFTDGIELDVAPKRGSAQVWKILESLWDIRPASRGTNLLRVLEYLETGLKRSTLIFCITDFIASEEIFDCGPFVRLAREHDFVPLILEDPLEERLPEGRGFIRLHDPELGGEMILNLSEKKRRLYVTLMRERKVALRRSLYRLNLDHLFLRTDGPFFESILSFFLARKKARRFG